ncbi:MAG: hypothetical protein DHS20C17_21120 [Cyclobacteriaceae bacterium]|nr:MAG: hypothetical protein DHS20C17_21120 [Cyclobacteriaceae bacterium]
MMPVSVGPAIRNLWETGSTRAGSFTVSSGDCGGTQPRSQKREKIKRKCFIDNTMVGADQSTISVETSELAMFNLPDNQ